jgi:membrane protein required for colicin V production
MADLQLTAFDVAVLIVIAVSVLIALMRGLTREALGIASWLGAGAVAWYGFGYARELARQTIETGWLADAAAFGATFVLPLVGFKIVAAMVSDHVPGGGGIGLMDRIGGLAFGAARGAVIVSAAYLGLTMVIAEEEQPAWVREAVVLPYVQDGAEMLQRLIPGTLALQGREAADTALRRSELLGRTARQLVTE